MKKNKTASKAAAYRVIGSEKKKSAELRSGHPESVNENVSSVDQKPTNVIEEVKASPRRKSDPSQKKKFFDELVQREGSVEKLLQIKTAAKTVYDVDRMSSIEIRESLARVDAKTTEPFSFLAKIIDDPEKNRSELTQNDKSKELNPTDIDLQLASLLKRVELNRTLLENANQRIKDINFLTERSRMVSLRDTNYDEKSFLKLREAGDAIEPISAADLDAAIHPAVDELQKTMSTTIEMLGYVHKMTTGDLASGEIPPALTDYLSGSVNTRDN